MTTIATKGSRRVAGKNYPIKGSDLTVLALAARTAATNDSGSFDTSEVNTVVLNLVVTAHSGTTPTLDVKLQTSDDGGSTWADVGTFTQVGNANSTGERKRFTGVGALCRVHSALGGTTPSYTYSVIGYTK